MVLLSRLAKAERRNTKPAARPRAYALPTSFPVGLREQSLNDGFSAHVGLVPCLPGFPDEFRLNC